MKKLQLVALLAGLFGVQALFGATLPERLRGVPMSIAKITNLTEDPIRIAVKTGTAFKFTREKDLMSLEAGESYVPQSSVYEVEIMDKESYITGIMYEPGENGLVIRNMFGPAIGVFGMKSDTKFELNINKPDGEYDENSTGRVLSVSVVK